MKLAHLCVVRFLKYTSSALIHTSRHNYSSSTTPKKTCITLSKCFDASMPSVLSFSNTTTSGINCVEETSEEKYNRHTTKHKPKRSSHYICDANLANTVASTILEHTTSKKCTLIEANPGSGMVTSALFAAGFSNIVGLESNDKYLPDLQVVQQEVGSERFQYFLFDLFAFWQRDHLTTSRGISYKKTETDIINYLTSKDVSSDGPICVFGMPSSNKEHPFFNYLLQEFLLEEGLFSIGQFHWYLFVSAKIYREVLTCQGNIQSKLFYNKIGILLYLLFDVRLLMEVPNNRFFPAFPKKRKNEKTDYSNCDPNLRYLLHLTPKRDVDQILPPEEMIRFMTFLKQLLTNKGARLIPRMERLVPGCGIHLIKHKLSMTQSIFDTSPQQMIDIYKMMQQWPEYPHSPMHFHLSEVTLEEEEETEETSVPKTIEHEKLT